MKGSLRDNISIAINWFLFLGVAFVGVALHSATKNESQVIVILAWIWVAITYVLTMFRMYEDSEQKKHERNHFIIKVEYDKDSPIRSEIVNSFSGKLSEFEEQCAIEMFCRNAINEKCREIREANRNA